MYTMKEIQDVLRHGIDPKALAGWPLVSLPENVITVARMKESEGDPCYVGAVEEAQRPRRGLRTEWGIFVVDRHEMDRGSSGDWVLRVEAYLTDDPYLELPHLRNEPGETVGIYLSDLANGAIEDGPAAKALESLDMTGLGPTDSDVTGQLFALFGLDRPDQQLDYAALGRLLADWLRRAEVDTVLHASRQPAALRFVDEMSGLHISRAKLH
ncbi:hypothetical protein [Cupriavidus necator]|uniref:hypothetical protein n=2 Tax=Cupriavidus necator TaxID=106590 RepID=UPI00129E7F68|nr:hypothetical protein [Cupriavidus necator]